ncbi:MAG: hypothetical protein JSS49_25370 [Planctomycetes bacterium]|nr:hypothetical protein [Planctomycetota bacterium]
MSSRKSIPYMLIVCGLSLNATAAHAQFLADRLVPPQTVVQPPIPMVAQPTEPGVFGAEKPRLHLWALPFGTFPGSPTVLTTELQPANWQRPVLDTPVLASDADPVRPTVPVTLIAPRAYAPAPNSAESPVLARSPIAIEQRVLAVDDPTAGSAFAALTVPVSLATPNPLPLLRLSIPDPFEQLRTIRLGTPPSDVDDPSTAQDRPPLSKLPDVEAPKP